MFRSAIRKNEMGEYKTGVRVLVVECMLGNKDRRLSKSETDNAALPNKSIASVTVSNSISLQLTLIVKRIYRRLRMASKTVISVSSFSAGGG